MKQRQNILFGVCVLSGLMGIGCQAGKNCIQCVNVDRVIETRSATTQVAEENQQSPELPVLSSHEIQTIRSPEPADHPALANQISTTATTATTAASETPQVKEPTATDATVIQMATFQKEAELAPPPVPEKQASENASLEYESPAISGQGMSLAEIEEMALQYNPTIRQLAASAQKARHLRDQVGRKANPTIGYSGTQLADEGTDQHVAFIEREFVTGGKLGLNQRIFDQEIQTQLWEVETQRQRVLTDIRISFYEALANQRRVELTNRFHEVAEKGVDIADQRKKAFEGSQVELLQAQIQLNEVDLSRQQAEFAYRGSWLELMALAGLPNCPPQKLAGNLDIETLDRDWELIYQSLLHNSPELEAARSRVQRARINRERQDIQSTPNVTVQLGTGVDNSTNSGMLNLEISAPLPVYNDNSDNTKAAYAEYCRAIHEVKRIELALKSRLAQVSREYDAALAAVRKYENEILPKANETLDLAEEAYVGGEFDFLQVLTVRRTFFDSNIQAVQARAQFAQANSKIEGLLLTGGLDQPVDFGGDDGLRGQTFDQQ